MALHCRRQKCTSKLLFSWVQFSYGSNFAISFYFVHACSSVRTWKYIFVVCIRTPSTADHVWILISPKFGGSPLNLAPSVLDCAVMCIIMIINSSLIYCIVALKGPLRKQHSINIPTQNLLRVGGPRYVNFGSRMEGPMLYHTYREWRLRVNLCLGSARSGRLCEYLTLKIWG